MLQLNPISAMLSRTGRQCASTVLSSSSRSCSLPSFLLPAFQSSPQPTQPFSTSATYNSRIGSAPIAVPQEVQYTVTPAPPAPKEANRRLQERFGKILVKGPLGEASYSYPSYVTLNTNEKGEINVGIDDKETRKHREMWGTTRSYIQNYITGVSEGHICILRLVGVGFRATVESTATTVEPEFPGQKFINLKVGYSHPIELGIPSDIKASTPQPTRILLEGIDKREVAQFAAIIRKWRVPEPYKGKGIFVNDETIKMKNKKVK